MASLAATQFQPLFPNLTVYTFGEPRTGDALYVQAAETNFLASDPRTTRYFRSTRKQNEDTPRKYCVEQACKRC